MVKHKISINIAKASGTMQIRRRILDFLFGQQVNVLVLSPSDSVQTVEIHELKGGENHDKRKQV